MSYYKAEVKLSMNIEADNEPHVKRRVKEIMGSDAEVMRVEKYSD